MQVKWERDQQKPPLFTISLRSPAAQSSAAQSPAAKSQTSYQSSESSRQTPHAYTLPVRDDESARSSFDSVSQGSREALDALNYIGVLKAKLTRSKDIKKLLKMKVDELKAALQETQSILSISTLTHGEDQTAAGAMIKKSFFDLAVKLPPL